MKFQFVLIEIESRAKALAFLVKAPNIASFLAHVSTEGALLSLFYLQIHAILQIHFNLLFWLALLRHFAPDIHTCKYFLEFVLFIINSNRHSIFSELLFGYGLVLLW